MTTTTTPVAFRGRLLAVLLTGQFMANVDTAIVNVAAPSIAAELAATGGQLALVVSGYLVAYAVLVVTGARLGAAHGHRRVFCGGLALFTLASLACGLATGPVTLIAVRFAQGAGAGLMVPQVLSGIQLHFTGPHRMRALGWYAIALSGGAVTGQVLGGLLVSANLFGLSWRPIFLINVVLGVPLLAAARLVLPRDDGRGDRPVTAAPVVALSVSVLLLIVPLVLGRDQHWPLWTWLCLAASVPAFVGFLRVDRRAPAPLIAPEVFRDPLVRNGLLAHGLTTMTYFSLLFVLALYLQQGLRTGPVYSGLAMVSWVVAFGVGGKLPVRFLPRRRAVTGCLVLATGYVAVWVYLLAGGRAGLPLSGLLTIGGLGLGISASALVGTMTSALPDRYAADLSGLITTNAQLTGALGIAVAGTAYLALPVPPATAFTLVLIGFTVLALLGATAATRTTRALP
ncbi:MFS transporter [Amycolatopsis cynarae]|uniref:MFS transporter n=1 Tax=Amycolatopsis cynarae TaxID=2995223 RepID=A0ABY7AX28_9PSEU|nr:MFS transporter [Amycolatopsis sp. HUAS 11-8]WAL64564.1 MFS transporter [Amycolatopsis sp. HUAS 11-8]